MSRPLSLVALSILMLSLVLAACAKAPSPSDASAAVQPDIGSQPQPERTPRTKDTLGGFHWRLRDATDANGRRIDALLVRPEQPIQFDFKDGRIAIHNACNSIGGDVRRRRHAARRPAGIDQDGLRGPGGDGASARRSRGPAAMGCLRSP